MKQVYMILTNGFDPDVRVYKEAKYLVNNGFKVTILCWDRKCEYMEKTEEIIDGINVKRFHILSEPGTGMKQLSSYLKFIIQVRKYLNEKEYEYLHCHDFDGVVVGFLLKNRKHKKIIFDMHEIYSDFAYGKLAIFKIIFKYIVLKCNYIIYVNDAQKENLSENIKKKIVYIPNYPENHYYQPIEKKIDDKLKINYIGAVRDFKSLSCLAEIDKDDGKIQVGIYGDGVSYQKLYEKYNTRENVKIYGKYNGIQECGEIYRNTNILYCSYDSLNVNWKNAFPVKLYEAVITKTPVIVTKNTVAANFVVENCIGEVIDYNDVTSLEDAVKKIQENYDEYIENLSKISSLYCWDSIITNINKIYDMK